MAGWHHQFMNLDKPWEMVRDRAAWRGAVPGVAESDRTWRLNKSDRELRPTNCSVCSKDKRKTESRPKPPDTASHYTRPANKQF